MPQILVIRLHPDTPIGGTRFSDFLTGLKISAFDLSVGDPNVGQHIGDAAFMAPAAPPIPDPGTTIVQHYTPPIPPLPLTIYAESEATAVIPITLPAGYKEYVTPDVRLEISRGGAKIASKLVYYDVNVVTVGALPAPATYPAIPASEVGIYLPLPRPLSPGLAQIDLSQGQAPDFESLKTAVQTVLAADQGPVPAITDITPVQATHIANEIIWGPQDPLPAAPASGTTGFDDLGALYTNPPNDGTIGNQLEQNRQQFEGNLNSYYATHNANVDRLARYTFALGCAMACEKMSIDAEMALMVFPVNPGVPSPTTTISSADVVLVQSGGGTLAPAFKVPAEYFYALGIMLPMQMPAKQRYQLACRDNEERTLPALTSAVDAGTISDSLAVNPAQAARRIAALVPGVQYDATAPHCEVDATLTPLINDWLAYPSAANWRDYHPGDDTVGFWTPEIAAQPNAYLSLDLAAVTNDHQPLIAAIRAIPVTSVSQLSLMSVTDWNNLFGTPPNIVLLPPFTAPGTAQARVAAFIRRVQKFFAVGFGIATLPSAAAPAAPVLDLPTADVIADWVSAYQALVGGTFSFGAGALVDANVTAAAQTALPGDPSAQAWLVQRVTVLNALCQLAGVASNVMPPVPSLAFSIAEALYARGFTSAMDINRLNQADFADAMRGTVAFDQANAIWSAAGGVIPPAPPPPGPFQPVNPGGLENCVPPCYLSPTGTVEYLHELLRLSENSTCATPAAPPDQGRPTLEEAMAARRSDPGLLDVSAANAMTPLPLVDIVIEQLENLVAPPASGSVYNTAEHHLNDHKLCSADECADVVENTDKCQPPASLFRALSEFNSPATPVANRATYDALKTDFSSPALPYSQPLDVNRAYLDALSSCRFAAMRGFRKEITEFALDPTVVAPTFQSHLWRYPVKIDIGIEYLGISPEEYALLFTHDIALVPTPGQLVLYELYGFPVANPGGFNWVDVVLRLPEFLKRTGLTYCELVELQKSNCFRFAVVQQPRQRDTNAPAGTDATSGGENSGLLPACEPCCPEHYRIVFQDPKNPLDALRFLAVYLRLWRKLGAVCGARYTFTQLCDICEVLQLFIGGSINPDFIRQLASFQILRDQFSLRLTDGTAPKGAHGADRTHLLALWAAAPPAAKWNWAVRQLVDRVMRYSQTLIDHCPKRPPHFIKLLVENLDSLSALAGFSTTVAKDSWHAVPTHTLRFAEVLAKITASRFGIGELLYLFSVEPHLDGDDPFPLQDANESLDHPFDLPEEESRQNHARNEEGAQGHSLDALRKKLLAVAVDESEIHDWTWHRIESALKMEFGYAVPPGGTDYLTSLGKHFFPRTLERAGVAVGATDRQYRTPLTTASPDMWNTPAEGPFRFDAATNELYTQLPLSDRAVIEKLVHLRDLTLDEQHAVQNLLAMPRVDLAPFAMLFPDFAAAEQHLIAEHDEERRWHWFRERFALMVKRCHVIAAHLVGHVGAVASASLCGCTDAPLPHETQTAWLILRHLFGDENRGLTSWESDSGAIPDVMWKPLPSGGAFAALLGLVGTGLMGEFHTSGGELVWRELRANMRAFDTEKNERNAPLPTILPALELSLSPEQLKLFGVRNGFAIQNRRGTELGGAAGFHIKWRGVLMVDEEGRYHFEADVPRGNAGKEKGEGGEGERECNPERRWRVTLSRGQKAWAVLSHHWKDEPGESGSTLHLKSGAYNLEVEFFQNEPQFAGEDDVCPLHTGFEVKYSGADTHGQLVVLPLDKLFCTSKDEQLIGKMSFPKGSSVAEYLYLRYTSTLRDIRRTYQRAFKALLFAHRFALTGHPAKPFGQSELGYMFAHADLFAGVSYYRNPGFVRHAANFDMNLLPLLDYYQPPAASQDQRTLPSSQRRQALFDWWERMFDYSRMRGSTDEREDESGKTTWARARPVWLLFEQAAEKQPDNPAQLLRHLDVDLDHAPCVLSYFSTQTTPVYKIDSDDLKDDRWAVRVWHADHWIDELVERCPPNDIRLARPDLWASDDPGALVPGEAQTGNVNLVRLFENAMIESDEPDLRRYDDLQKINDCLRVHARAHLLAYLCGMNRVPLPWGGYAKSPEALSALLLIDVEAGFCERASRIEEGITAVQTFVQRARLGLEDWAIGPSFLSLWKNVFASYRVWESCRCRTLYRENWIAWDELRKARRIEAFQFLEDQLRRSTLTLAAPGGLEYWAASLPPAHPAVELLQQRTPSSLRLLTPPREGLGVLGTPERDARPSWLAPDSGMPQGTPQGSNNPSSPTIARVADTRAAGAVVATSASSTSPAAASDKLPFWIEAAIRLGVRFIRVAAGGVPPAAAAFVPSDFHAEPGCCTECGCVHPPLVDEYYFWLVPAQTFDEPFQDEYYDPSEQISLYWHDPQQIPTLLDWKPESAVRLAWCRVHNGEFKQPRHSAGLVKLSTGATPDLTYVGRLDDSLTFAVTGGIAPTPVGYNGTDAPGFRYDMAVDRCVTLPLVADPTPVASSCPAGLPAYPYFVFVEPGERLFVESMFSPSIEIADALRCHCHFEPALKWYELVRNPLQSDNMWVHCSTGNQPGGGTLGTVDVAGQPADVAVAEQPSATHGSSTDGVDVPGPGRAPLDMCCDSTNISAQTARDRAIVLAYAETLVEWARALMRKNSRESAQEARLILDTASAILGPCPPTVHNPSRPHKQTVATFVPLNPPLNPRLMQLYCHVRDGLSLVHRCLSDKRLRNPDVAGACGSPYWGQDPCCCDPASHRPCDEPVCCEDDAWCHPLTQYRFVVLMQKARECVGHLREMGTALLGAFERGDGEYLAQMHARHETELADMTVDIRQQQWREADWQVQALRKGKEVQQTNRRYTKRLIDVGLINGELDYQDNMNNEIGLRTTATEIEAVAEAMELIPDLFVGFPCEETWLPLGTKLAGMFKTIARITNEIGEIAGLNAQLDLTQAGWQRRLDEWVHQVEVLDLEIEQMEIQILAAERKAHETLLELNLHQQSLEQSRERLNLLRDKFTSHELWLYLQKEGMAMYWQMYELAQHVVRQAQRAFNFELGFTGRNFLPCESWNGLQEGLLAGDKLQLALDRMEKEYLQCHQREYELTKHVSLALHFPLQFLQLRLTGYCEIEIPEWMFDMDYPGQYMRRLKSVSVTIPCVTGPYTGVHCKLTLLHSWTRIDPCLPCPVTHCCNDKPKGACGCRHPLHEHYEAGCCDPRGVKLYGAREAIATSSGRNDAGLFELNFHDDRHLPFEYAGAVSCWRIELPQESNYFDLDTLADTVLHLNYTSREGGTALRDAARAAIRERLPGNGWVYLDVHRDFPDVWEQLRRSRSAMQDGVRRRSVDDAHPGGVMTLPVSRRLFPYLPGDPSIKVTKVAVLFDSSHCCEQECPHIDACPCAHEVKRGSHLVEVTVDHPDSECSPDEFEIECRSSVDWPGLYHGSGELRIAPLDNCHPGHTMTLNFADRICGLERVFVLCRYEVIERCCETVRPGSSFDVHEGGCHDCA
ncbi:insecticidal toxin complex protein [Burkholderia stabilis]|uniref:Insecticidal toxin complex protein n=1 Tax=Burkholderia stabilis TaxID=95485 RepID=A0A4Q2A8G7_9BURK|nr:neuraminidase-like domain-containing protein [Burkholderia stabilis]RXV65692.1 insecticidal toxin complex protein [Burkholderia stabilis]